MAYGAAANKLEVTADEHCQQLSAPGGSEWAGEAADIAREAAYAARGVVYHAADHLRDMVKVANLGAQNLSQARERALDAIDEAEADDFQVGDDLSVTDTRRYTQQQMSQYFAREAKAEEHHNYIAMRAGILVSEDTDVGAKLDAGATALSALVPQHWNQHGKTAPTDSSDEPDLIQNIDYSHDGWWSPPPGPSQEETPAGKEWHFYPSWGWVLEDPLKDCSGQEEAWDLAQIGGGLGAAVFGGPIGIVTGVPAAGAGMNDLSQCDAPG